MKMININACIFRYFIIISIFVLSYVLAISVFLSVTIAGLRFTVDGGGESKKILIYHDDITKKYI